MVNEGTLVSLARARPESVYALIVPPTCSKYLSEMQTQRGNTVVENSRYFCPSNMPTHD